MFAFTVGWLCAGAPAAAPAVPVATLLSAIQQSPSTGSASSRLQLRSRGAGGPDTATLHGLLRTAAQEGCAASVVSMQADAVARGAQPGECLSTAASCCLAFSSSSQATVRSEEDGGHPLADVYGSVVGGGGLRSVPRLVPYPAAYQADAFAPYKLLPLPRCGGYGRHCRMCRCARPQQPAAAAVGKCFDVAYARKGGPGFNGMCFYHSSSLQSLPSSNLDI